MLYNFGFPLAKVLRASGSVALTATNYIKIHKFNGTDLQKVKGK
jgi:hypothetical protein